MARDSLLRARLSLNIPRAPSDESTMKEHARTTSSPGWQGSCSTVKRNKLIACNEAKQVEFNTRAARVLCALRNGGIQLQMAKQRSHTPTLVVVTPVYNEAENLDRYCAAVERVLLSREDINVRLILVDDGSTDGSWRKMEQIARHNSRFAAIRLSRNFGAHTALTAGFDFVPANADIVATLACDLQDPPETILAFVDAWRANADIVWGARRSRLDGRRRGLASRLLLTVLRRYAMPKGSKFQTGSFFLVDKTVLDCMRQFREHGRVTFALVAWTGFDQEIVNYDRQPRVSGRSGWTYMQMLNTAYDVFIGFSPVPAKVLTTFGFVMLGGSILSAIYIIVWWLFFAVQPGWTALMATMTLCFGLLFVMIGMSFEYLYRIFIETKHRPLYFVAGTAGNVSECALPQMSQRVLIQ